MALGLLGAGPLAAQKYLSSPRRALTAPELLDAPDEWIARSLAWVDDMLARRPSYLFQVGKPLDEEAVHRAALIRLDDLLHIEGAPQKVLLQEWFRRRMLGVAQRASSPAGGYRILKVYNQGWHVTTPTARFVLDLVGGPPKNAQFRMSDEAIDLLVQSADVLFISHLHDDHADPEVAKRFLAKGKTVVAPAQAFAKDPELQKRVTVPGREMTKLAGFEFIALPGHQGKDVTNNNYLVRAAEGLNVMHTGDQWNDGDFAWIDEIHKQYRVTVLMPNCWTQQPLRFAAGVKPQLILPGHENEMAHTVPHREDWTQTFTRWDGAGAPMLPLCWGEEVIVKL